ncbi:MAG TPA: flagellar basal body rod C-terminal domain-containing protein, partial [Candidatus Eremiobacteraceae bacterium]|nr:flagellar basal body rod C-terminal domain-containing protein [Candidatus Eremiobacteraceae bacterium]
RAGRVNLFAFACESALRAGDDGLFYPTAGAGRVISGVAGGGGFGRIKQHALERANVGIVDSMMAVLAAQRAYEADAKTVQAADEMLRLANNLERP